MTAVQHRSSVSELPQLFEQVELIDVDDELVRRAGDVAETRSLLVYDAVHLAAALRAYDPDRVLVAGDSALLSAATAEGLTTAPTF